MKRFYLLLSVILILSCSKKDDTPDDITPQLNPTQEQWGLVINYTAKWCGPCGSWGSTTLHEMAGLGKVVAVTNHASGDPMYNPNLFLEMDGDRAVGSGIPSFWVGDSKTSSVSAMTQLLEKVPIAGIDMKTTRSGDVINISARVKFFSAGTGDYYLSFWMLESGIDGSANAGSYAQAGTSNPQYKHDFVLRQAASGVWGEKILTDPTANAIYDKTLTMDVGTSWTNEVYIVACLWNHLPQSNVPRYKYVNGFLYK